MRTYLKALFASLLAICFTACSNDDDTKPLQFEKTSYEICKTKLPELTSRVEAGI